jgi:large subunit ribosomal protein L15
MNKHRLMTRLKYMPDHWGMHGFNRDPSLRKVSLTVNVSDLVAMAGDSDSINLAKHGIDKLLGSGRIEKSIQVTVESASVGAVAKIEAAGGSIIIDDGADWEEE